MIVFMEADGWELAEIDIVRTAVHTARYICTTYFKIKTETEEISFSFSFSWSFDT